MIEMKASYHRDRTQALQDTKDRAALALPAEDKAGIDDAREMERRVNAVADQAHRRWLVSDDAEMHVEQIRPYIELGFNHPVFHAPGDDRWLLKRYGERSCRDFARRVRSPRWAGRRPHLPCGLPEPGFAWRRSRPARRVPAQPPNGPVPTHRHLQSWVVAWYSGNCE
jgi:hypothetical protein